MKVQVSRKYRCWELRTVGTGWDFQSKRSSLSSIQKARSWYSANYRIHDPLIANNEWNWDHSDSSSPFRRRDLQHHTASELLIASRTDNQTQTGPLMLLKRCWSLSITRWWRWSSGTMENNKYVLDEIHSRITWGMYAQEASVLLV